MSGKEELLGLPCVMLRRGSAPDINRLLPPIDDGKTVRSLSPRPPSMSSSTHQFSVDRFEKLSTHANISNGKVIIRHRTHSPMPFACSPSPSSYSEANSSSSHQVSLSLPPTHPNSPNTERHNNRAVFEHVHSDAAQTHRRKSAIQDLKPLRDNIRRFSETPDHRSEVQTRIMSESYNNTNVKRSLHNNHASLGLKQSNKLTMKIISHVDKKNLNLKPKVNFLPATKSDSNLTTESLQEIGKSSRVDNECSTTNEKDDRIFEWLMGVKTSSLYKRSDLNSNISNTCEDESECNDTQETAIRIVYEDS